MFLVNLLYMEEFLASDSQQIKIDCCPVFVNFCLPNLQKHSNIEVTVRFFLVKEGILIKVSCMHDGLTGKYGYKDFICDQRGNFPC